MWKPASGRAAGHASSSKPGSHQSAASARASKPSSGMSPTPPAKRVVHASARSARQLASVATQASPPRRASKRKPPAPSSMPAGTGAHHGFARPKKRTSAAIVLRPRRSQGARSSAS